jgi:hypothetical protein
MLTISANLTLRLAQSGIYPANAVKLEMRPGEYLRLATTFAARPFLIPNWLLQPADFEAIPA